jgi:hypothetical protein
MKKAGYSVELVTEYAKDMVWEDRFNILDDQLYILAKQNRRLLRLKDKVDFVITDSPLLLGLVYTDPLYYPAFHNLVLDVWNSYRNQLLFIRRPEVGYEMVGRMQDNIQAKAIDGKILNLLDRYCIEYKQVQPTVVPVTMKDVVTPAADLITAIAS